MIFTNSFDKVSAWRVDSARHDPESMHIDVINETHAGDDCCVEGQYRKGRRG
jgi:hypothetical protein